MQLSMLLPKTKFSRSHAIPMIGKIDSLSTDYSNYVSKHDPDNKFKLFMLLTTIH